MLNYVDTDVFRFLIDLEIQKAVRLKYGLSLVCLAIDLPPDDADPSLTKQVAESAIAHLRGTDVVTILGHTGFALLLVDAEPASVRGVVGRAMEAFEIGALNPGYRGARLTWSAGGSFYPRTAAHGTELLDEAIQLMNRAKQDGGHRLYLPSVESASTKP